MKYLYILACATLLLSCSNNNEDNHRVPWAPVQFSVSLNGYDKELDTRGASKIFTKPRLDGEQIGFSGLIIVSNLISDDSGNPTLSAFDVCCPYEAKQNIKISMAIDGKVKCETCKSVYDLYSGGKVVSGPSEWWLKSYRVREKQPYTGTFFIEN